MKQFYRIANRNTNQGLWYDIKGKFTGIIHEKFKFCKNTKLPMRFDNNVCGWLSVTDTLEDLYHWFSREDIARLEKFGYFITLYESEDFRFYGNHYLIDQKTSRLITRLSLEEVRLLEPIA